MMTRVFSSFDQFTRFFDRLAATQRAPFVLAAEITSRVLHRRAVNVFGDNSKLANLAPSTQDERQRLGYTADDPLLRTGKKLRDHVERLHVGMVAAIGSSDPVQAYHEFGYPARDGSRVPTRPVFETALTESEPEIAEIISMACGVALGARPNVGRLAEILGD